MASFLGDTNTPNPSDQVSQSFGDKIAYGDMYYDLAKMYHSFLFPHPSVQSKKFYIDKLKILIFVYKTFILLN